MSEYYGIGDNVVMEEGVRIFKPTLVNIYGCNIGAGTTVGPFVEIQKGVTIGKNCKISSHSFVCEGISLGDGVFVGHGVMFTNDRFPAAVTESGELKTEADWRLEYCAVGAGASIGSGATILPGISIGEHALVGAGAVVSKDVPPYAVVVGNPARIVGDVREKRKKKNANA